MAGELIGNSRRRWREKKYFRKILDQGPKNPTAIKIPTLAQVTA
jgi:hypothetical protein